MSEKIMWINASANFFSVAADGRISCKSTTSSDGRSKPKSFMGISVSILHCCISWLDDTDINCLKLIVPDPSPCAKTPPESSQRPLVLRGKEYDAAHSRVRARALYSFRHFSLVARSGAALGMLTKPDRASNRWYWRSILSLKITLRSRHAWRTRQEWLPLLLRAYQSAMHDRRWVSVC